MKMNLFTIKQQTQEFILRLFIESSGGTATGSDSQYYISSHCGTYSRLHS